MPATWGLQPVAGVAYGPQDQSQWWVAVLIGVPGLILTSAQSGATSWIRWSVTQRGAPLYSTFTTLLPSGEIRIRVCFVAACWFTSQPGGPPRKSNR